MTAPGGNWEAQRVAELRERGIPWPHVAKQVGRNEIDIRRTYDPALKVGAVEPAVIQLPTPVAKPIDLPRRAHTGAIVRRVYAKHTVKPKSRQARVLGLLATNDWSAGEVCEALGWKSRRTASSVIGALCGRGLAQPLSVKRPIAYGITERGKAALAAVSESAGLAKLERARG